MTSLTITWEKSVASTTPTYTQYTTSCSGKIGTTLKWSADEYITTLTGEHAFPTLTTSPDDLTGVTYSSSNTAVAEIDANTGIITIKGIGETTITASFAGNDTYDAAADANYTLIVADVFTVSYAVDALDDAPNATTVVQGSAVTLPNLPTTLNCVSFIGWTDDQNVYTHGTSKLYKAGDSYTVTENVTLHAVYAAGGGYVLVEDVATLTSGMQVIIANTDNGVAMGEQKSNNRGEVQVTISENTLTPAEGVEIFTLEDGTSAGTFAFKTSAGYIYAVSSGDNYLRTQSTKDANGSWKITITDGVTSIVAQGENSRNTMQYNSGSKIFSCYSSSSQKPVSLYAQNITNYTTDPECVTYSVSACDNLTNGTITIEKTTVDPYGSTNVTFVPNNGYMLESVNVTPSSKATVQEFTADVTGNRTLKISNIQSDIEVCATFKAIPFYKVTFIDMNADPQTSTEVFQSEFGGDITAPPTASDGCDVTWTFIGWAPSNDLNGASEIPNGLVAPGGTISGSLITDNSLTYYSVYSNSSDGTPPFSIGKSGTYHMYALDGTTKYYATTNRYGNALYAGEEESNDFNTYPKAKVKLTYNSNTNKYKIQITTFGNNPTDGYLYHPDATKQDITHNSLENYTEFTLQNGSASGYNIVYNYTVQQLQGNVYVPVVKTGCFGKSNSYFNASTTITDVYFEPASEMRYYNASDCPDDYVTMSFHNPFVESGVQLTYEDGYEEDYYKNTSKKYVDVFPTLEYAGWTFIGWTAGSSYNADIGDENLNDENSSASAPTQDIYKTGGGLSYYLDLDVTMYPIFTKFEDNEPFDMVKGGDYYIYYIADKDVATSEDEYGATNRIYAGGWGSGGTSNSYGSTQSCASATLFTFTKLSNGKWSIYDNTKGKYLCAGATDNNLALNTTTTTYGEWTITVYNGNQVNAVSRDGYTLSAYSQDAVTGTFKNYATSNFNNNSKYYHRVYLGTCTERVFSSNPTNQLTVTWNPNGGQWADGSTFKITQSYEEGDTFSAPETPTREGYTFAGWSDGENTYDENDTFTMPAEKVTYTAIWEINQYTVTWKLAGGSVNGSTDDIVDTYDFGASITVPTNPTRTGYTFGGWLPTVAETMPAHDATYVAQWIELTNFRTLCEYTVTWELAGGQIDGSTDDIVNAYTRGQEIVPPTHPTLDGWKFMGWDPEFVAGTTMQGEDLTYVAQWAKAYTVTYYANGGFTDCEDNSMYAAGDEVTVCATTPTKIGHAFAGWQRNDDSSIVQANGTFTMPASNVTLIAQWNANQHTVTWNPGEGGHWDENFGAKVETYNYGDPIIVPDDPEKSGYVFAKWEPDVTATMPDEDLEYTAVWYNDFCESYTFHTGNADVWNSPQEQICFTHKEGTEWQITDYVIPTSDAQSHFLVAYRGWPQIAQGSLGGHSKSATSTWSATMYIAPTMDFSSADNSPKLGHAKGAIGTLRIFDDSSWDNLCVGFIPIGYGITLTSNSSGAKTAYAFNTTTTDHKLETNVVTLPGVTNNKYTVGLATQAEGEYVSCDHSNAAELINKMGVTEMVAGKRMVYLKPNDDWKSDGARFAAYFFNNGGNTWINMTDPDGDGIYGCEIPDGYSNVIFCRMNGGTTANNWDNKWNQTQDIALPSSDGLAKLYTITGWDNSCSGPTNLSPKTGQNGKFRMWDDSRSKNWYVHFIPYYLLTYNANGGEGEMPAEEYNTEDANNKVTIAANGFTRRGYDFVKWNTQADGAGTDYNSGDEYTMTSDATIYAQWKVQEYTINYKDQGNADYSGTNLDDLPTTHTYGIATTIPNGEKIGYTFEGWYLTPECDGTPITELVANDYIADITLYAKWTFAMEYDITNAEPVFITSAAGQTIKGTTPLTLAVSNMPVGTEITISAPHIKFYFGGEEVTTLTNKYESETLELIAAYTPENANTTEQPTITLDVLGYEKEISDKISCRSLPATFAIVAKVGNIWYALPSQGLNSITPPAAYPVEVDDMADPTAVIAVPENADWSLRGVYEASRSDATKDRYVANGDNLVFVNNASPAMTLNASSSEEENYLLTDAQYNNYYNTNPGLYEWTPITTDLETYQLTNEQRSRTLSVNTATVFGVHAQDKAVEQVRFLPIQDRYTPAALQVVEWKENSVVIMYNGDPAQTASVSVNGAAAQNTTLSAAQRDIAVYELAANGLAANPTQRLSITIGTEKVILSIPYIISGAQTDLALLPGSTVAARQEAAKVSDLVILKDATLTADGAKSNLYKFRNVTIYGGGKLVIPSEAKGFGVASLTLRAGGITDAGEYDYVYPQFELRGTFTNSAAKINYDYITDYYHWYHLVLPFAGDLETIKYPTEFYGANVAVNNEGSWQIKRYAGEIRATGNYDAWKDIETEGKTSTIAGQGYIFWGAPKKVSVNGGDTERQKWGIQRITMSVTAPNAMTAENGDKAISELSSYATVEGNSGKDNDQGWNLIGNPYMVNLTDMATTGLHACKLVEVIDPATGKWNGKWEWNDETNIRYLTIPSEHFDTYTAKTVNQAVPLVAGRAFFVQLEGEANGITFAAANRASLMPALRAADDKPVDIETGIILSNETLQDEVNFWIKDGKTNDYEYNADYPKTPNNNQFNIYGVYTNGDLSWVATGPEYAAESMPIGYQVPAAGTYMLSLSEIYNSDGLDALYVTDHALSPEVTVDIMSEPYEFSVNQAETNNERFTVSVRVKAKTENGATGLDNVGADGEQIHKFIYQDKIFILHHGVIYDATGKRVITINK